MHEVQNRLYSELYDAIYESKLRTKMHQSMCVDFKLGYVDAKSDAIAFCVKTYSPGLFINNRTNMHEVQNRLHAELYEAIYESKLRTKMDQNMCVDFKLGYVDAKSDAIAFCVKTYPSGSFIKMRTNMHETQNRMKIAFCVKPPLPSTLLAEKGGPT